MPARAYKRRPPSGQTAQTVTIPAPVDGLDAVSSGMAMRPTNAVRLYNLISAEYGVRSRLGYREWCTNLTGASDNYVRSIIPFTGSAMAGTNDKVFATTSSGIWDVTSSDTSPSLLIAFGTTTGDAGYGVSTVFVTSAGHFAIYCDQVNGMYLYTESTATWTKTASGVGAGQISNVDPANLVSVTAFKNRLWFIERDTDKAWYLDALAIAGAATAFRMGHKFQAGGSLRALVNLTYDGGGGMDDSLVGISDGGDVLVWQLTDPDLPGDTLLKGYWSVGAVPAGRHIASAFGGDVLILSKSGLVSLSTLVTGAQGSSQYATTIIGPLFNAAALASYSLPGWSIRQHPEDSSIIITVPTTAGSATKQFAMSLSRKSWSEYRDLPIYSSAVASGKLYFGTTDGRVCINDGYLDNVQLSDSSYTPVQWALLTAFQKLGGGRQCQVQMIRPTIISEGSSPSYSTQARYNFNFTELATVSGSVADGDGWDSGEWDEAVWAGEYAPSFAVNGAAGMGTDVAIAMRGIATSRTVIVGIDVTVTAGGFL